MDHPLCEEHDRQTRDEKDGNEKGQDLSMKSHESIVLTFSSNSLGSWRPELTPRPSEALQEKLFHAKEPDEQISAIGLSYKMLHTKSENPKRRSCNQNWTCRIEIPI